jgi:hypothetical protein
MTNYNNIKIDLTLLYIVNSHYVGKQHNPTSAAALW